MKNHLLVLVISVMKLTQWCEARHKQKEAINQFQQNNSDTSRNSIGGVSELLSR